VNKADVKPGYYAEFPIEWLRDDADTQARVKISRKVVGEYANAMARGDKFTPADIFWNGSDGFIGDGHHRYRGTRLAELATMPVFVHEGGLRDAILHSCGANAGQGRNGDDKRNAVTKLLLDGEWVKWSDREIARHCKVGPTLVGEVRAQLSASGQLKKVTHRKSKDGKTRHVAEAAAATRARGTARRASKITAATAPDSDGGLEHAPVPVDTASRNVPAMDESGHHGEDAAPTVSGAAGFDARPRGYEDPLVVPADVDVEASEARAERAASDACGIAEHPTPNESSVPVALAREMPVKNKQEAAARTRRFRTTNRAVLTWQEEIVSLIDGRPTLHIPFARISLLAQNSISAIKEVES
jgi:hypothetical protein